MKRKESKNKIKKKKDKKRIRNTLVEKLGNGKTLVFSTAKRIFLKRSYQQIYSGLSQRIRILNVKSWKVVIGVVAVVLTISGSLYYFADYASAAYIVIDGQQVGLVSSVAAGQNLVQAVLQESGQPAGQIAKTNHKIDYRRAWGGSSTLRQKSLSKDELRDRLNPYVEGYATKVSGVPVATLANENDADKVLTDFKNFYAQPSDSRKVSSVEFLESVTTEKIETTPEKILPPDQVLAMLEKGKETSREYTVQPEDSLWLIARKNDMLTKEVLSSNPNLTEDTPLKPGQKLKLVSVTPYINVIVKGEYSVTETIPFDVQTNTDYNLAGGQTKVQQQGSDGSKVVTYAYEQKNNKITTRNIVDENVTTKPADKIIAQGPKASRSKQPVQIASSQISVSRSAGQVSRLIDNALSLQGIPYLWGNTTTKGFDCSGFVQYVFKSIGISLPRTSFDQYTVGVPVNRNNLQPGDLVFFNTYANASDVRIYIGGGLTIGSANEGVGIHSLSESYWSSRYLGARRILN